MSGSAAAKAQERKSAGRMDARSREQSPGPAMSGTYADILALQQSAGNQAVHGLVTGGIPPIVQSVINSGGQPLEPGLRTQMESRFGQDFSRVRIHTDGRAADSAEAVSAKAYTVGRDVVFGQGRYTPDTSDGKRLLAHELAHVVQQSRSGLQPALDLNAPHERAADQAAKAVAGGANTVTVGGATGVGLARDKDEDEERRSQANMTVITQRPQKAPPLNLPVQEINDPNKGKGTLAESTVPFALYSGWEWSHLGGGEETKSSRTSLARETPWGKTAGIDFIVENTKTGRLVIGEQKAVGKESFEKATAITTNLEKNIGQARTALQEKLDRGEVHPDEVARLKNTIARLDATEKALINARANPDSHTELPEGVVFELTNISGEGKEIGKGHIDLLAKKYGKNPAFLEHLLSRTFVRDPALAKAKGRDPSGQRGTDADPDVVPARKLLTEQAQKELDRLRSGKTEKQWKADKAKQKVADKKAASDARKAAAKAQREQRAADERKAREQARKAGAKARGERLRQLKDERAKKGEPEPTTKRKRQQTENTLKREAGKAGKAAERKSFEDFKAQRKQQEDAAKAKARTDAQARQKARQQQRDVQRQAQAQHEAQEAQAKQKREEAIQKAKKAGSLETPEPILKMNADARRRNQAQNRDQELGKAAHVVNQAAAAVRALDAYEDARGKGKGMFGAGVDAFKTYLDNTNPVMGAIANAEAKQRKDEKGEQYYGTDAVDAWLGTVGETGAGYIVPGAGWDQAINAGANLIGAVDDHVHKGRDPASPEAKKASVKDVTSLTADLTPSRMFSQTMGAGLRAYWDLEKAKQGDFKGIDKFGEDAVKGKLGPIFQPWAMGADFLGNLGGNSAGAAFDKTLKKSEDTTLAKVGTSGGDLAYALGQSKDAKAGKYGPTLQTYSTVLGMGNDMIAGKTFNQAIDKAASEGSTDAQGVKAVRDAAVAAEQKAKEVWNEDLPAAKKRVGEAIDKVEQVIDDPGKALSTAKNKLGRLWAKL